MANAPQEMDAALAASLKTRRERLQRAVRLQRIRMRISMGLSALIAIFALMAYLIGDLAAAKLCALIAVVTFVFAYVVGTAARKHAAEALRNFDQS